MSAITLLDSMLVNWWQIALTLLACSLSTALACWLNLHKPFPLSIILGGLQTLILVETIPQLYVAGIWHTSSLSITTWVCLTLLARFLPELQMSLSKKRSHESADGYKKDFGPMDGYANQKYQNR